MAAAEEQVVADSALATVSALQQRVEIWDYELRPEQMPEDAPCFNALLAGPYRKQKEALEKARPDDSMPTWHTARVFASHLPVGYQYWVANHKGLMERIMEMLPGEKEFYELFREGELLLPYFDVDARRDLNTLPPPREMAAMLVDMFRGLFEQAFGVPIVAGSECLPDQISMCPFIKDSSSEEKLSLHLVFRFTYTDPLGGKRLLVFEGLKSYREFLRRFVLRNELLPEFVFIRDKDGQPACMIDHNVFTKNRLFRMPWCHKHGARPWRTFVPRDANWDEVAGAPLDYLASYLPRGIALAVMRCKYNVMHQSLTWRPTGETGPAPRKRKREEGTEEWIRSTKPRGTGNGAEVAQISAMPYLQVFFEELRPEITAPAHSAFVTSTRANGFHGAFVTDLRVKFETTCCFLKGFRLNGKPGEALPHKSNAISIAFDLSLGYRWLQCYSADCIALARGLISEYRGLHRALATDEAAAARRQQIEAILHLKPLSPAALDALTPVRRHLGLLPPLALPTPDTAAALPSAAAAAAALAASRGVSVVTQTGSRSDSRSATQTPTGIASRGHGRGAAVPPWSPNASQRPPRRKWRE